MRGPSFVLLPSLPDSLKLFSAHITPLPPPTSMGSQLSLQKQVLVNTNYIHLFILGVKVAHNTVSDTTQRVYPIFQSEEPGRASAQSQPPCRS